MVSRNYRAFRFVETYAVRYQMLFQVFYILCMVGYASMYTPIVKKLSREEIEEIEERANQKPGVLEAFMDYDGKFELHWTYDNDTITFDVTVEAQGWVGLGFTPTYSMVDADIVMVWIDESGTAHISDCHASANGYPMRDTQQDYTLLSAYKNGTHFHTKFSRLRDTCDLDDYKLTSDNTRVLWAYSNVVPVDEAHLEQHEARKRGLRGLFLFDPPPSFKLHLPQDTVMLELLSDGAVLPTDNHMMYWCQVFEMPKWPVHHLVRFDGILEKGNEAYIHHMAIYQCSKNMSAYLGKGDRCFTGDGLNLSKMYECTNKFLWTWAPGIKPSDMPDGVGFPMFESPADIYIVLEMHYENLELKPGIVDHSGIRLYLTPTLRPVEAGIVYTAVKEGAPTFLIPPGEDEFHFYTYSQHCLSRILPPTGIKMMSNMLHQHLYGKRISMHHYRDGVQLPDILIDNNYDFYAESFRLLEPPRVVLPGDQLIVDCVYNSSSTNKTVYGGYSTLDEMCMSFFFYYPRVGRSVVCQSCPDPAVHVPMFGAQLIDNATVLLTTGQNVTLIDFVHDHLDWDWPGAREQYRQLVGNGTYLQYLHYQALKNSSDAEDAPVDLYITRHTGYPKVIQPWFPQPEKDQCSSMLGKKSVEMETEKPTTISSKSTESNKRENQKEQGQLANNNITMDWSPMEKSTGSTMVPSMMLVVLTVLLNLG